MLTRFGGFLYRAHWGVLFITFSFIIGASTLGSIVLGQLKNTDQKTDVLQKGECYEKGCFLSRRVEECGIIPGEWGERNSTAISRLYHG
jgi:hypothetical protein